MFYRKHQRVIAPVGEHSMTKQSHKDECDIYNILSQYQRTGMINHIQKSQPQFQDLPDAIDYQESLNLLIQAQDAFSQLPAKVRDRYRNDPQQFLAALEDQDEHPYLRDLGVLKPAPQPATPGASAPPSPAPAPAAPKTD